MEGLEEVKNILVTGGTGFIGSHLVESLVAENYTIFIPYIDLPHKSYFIEKQLHKKVIMQKINILNKTKLSSFIQKNAIDFIFHLAAQTIVTKAYKSPYETFQINIMGTINLLEIMRKQKNIQGMIFASSDKAYGKTKDTYTEKSALQGDHPYDVSKSSADLISQTYFKTYKSPVIITRFGNVYGEGDLHEDRIIPGLCEAIIKNHNLVLRSDGSFVRDYIYVKDVVEGYKLLFNKRNTIYGQAFNFSSKDTFSVIDLLKKSEEILHKKIPFIIKNSTKNEIPYQHLDDSKSKAIGWHPQFTLSSSLPAVLAWYTNYYK